MLTSKVLQNIIDGYKSITKCDLSITDKNGKILISTEDNITNRIIDSINSFALSPAEGQILKGYNYFKVFDNNIVEYIVVVKGEDGEGYKIGRLAAFQLQSLIVAYKERFDKDNFIKNLLLDNLLSMDIYTKAKKLNIKNKVFRVVYLIEYIDDKYVDIYEIIKDNFTVSNKDFITPISEKSIIIIKELEENYNIKELEEIADKIYKFLYKKLNFKVYISIGNVVNDLKDISLAYKEAKIALEIGQIFYKNKNTINYAKLDIYRLIYQLPVSTCKIFLDEILHGIKIENIDKEILETVNKLFENDLNISETARKLYIHRNTLVYRLDKLEKITGLDPRNFENAMIFKIILIINKYIVYKERFM